MFILMGEGGLEREVQGPCHDSDLNMHLVSYDGKASLAQLSPKERIKIYLTSLCSPSEQ